MNILHIANTARSSGGGISEVARNLFTQQRALGANVSLWFSGSCSDESKIREELGGAGLEIRAINANIAAWHALPLEFWKLWRAVEGFDVVHQHGIWLPTSLLTWHASKKRPTVISPHGAFSPYARKVSKVKKAAAWWCYERWNFGRADRLSVCSQMEMEEVRNAGLMNEVSVIGNGVSDEMFLEHAQREDLGDFFRERFDVSHGQRVLLFLSRLHPIKGLEILLEAVQSVAPKLRVENWQLIVAGDGETRYIKRLEGLVLERGIQDVVRLVGPLYGKERIAAYAAAEFFVLPSFGENFGIVVAEAMAIGLPVITSKNMPWQITEDGGFGLVVEAEPEAVAAAIDSLINLGKTERKAMGDRARGFALERLRWAGVAEETLVLYEELIKLKQKRAHESAKGTWS